MKTPSIPTFLPGRLFLRRGQFADYRKLESHHYCAGKPATSAGVWTIRYRARDRRQSRVVAVAVLSYPVPSCLPRRKALGITGSRDEELRFANRHIRTISRVIVHPQFRALGLSSILSRWICDHCDTRYVEAMAVMGRAHPLFERAGMTRYESTGKSNAIYYLLDRRANRRRAA